MRQYFPQRSEIAESSRRSASARAGGAAARREGPLAGQRVRGAAGAQAPALPPAGGDQLHHERPRSAAGEQRRSGQAGSDRPWYSNDWDGVDKADRPGDRSPHTPQHPTRERKDFLQACRRPRPRPTGPSPTPRTSKRSNSSSAARRAGFAPSRTAAPAASRTWCETAPRLPDGTPFPTLYYLTCPRAAAAIGTLEANGVMREMTGRLASDPELAAAYRAAHEHYLAPPRRHRGAAGLRSAGGMPDRVKCLHVLVGARAGRRARGEPARRRGARRAARVVGARAVRDVRRAA